MNEKSLFPRRVHSLQIMKKRDDGVTPANSIDNEKIKKENAQFELERRFMNLQQNFSFVCDQFVVSFQPATDAKSFSLFTRLFKCLSSDVSIMRNALEWNYQNHRKHGLVGYAIAVAPMTSESRFLEVTLCYTQTMINGNKSSTAAQFCTVVSRFVRVANTVSKQVNGGSKPKQHKLVKVCTWESEGLPPINEESTQDSSPVINVKRKSSRLCNQTSIGRSHPMSFSEITLQNPETRERRLLDSSFYPGGKDCTLQELKLSQPRSSKSAVFRSKSLQSLEETTVPLRSVFPPSSYQTSLKKEDSGRRGHHQLHPGEDNLPRVIPRRRDPIAIQNPHDVRRQESFVAIDRQPSLPPPPTPAPPAPPAEDADKTPRMSNKKCDYEQQQPKSLIRKAITKLSIKKRLSMRRPTGNINPSMTMWRQTPQHRTQMDRQRKMNTTEKHHTPLTTGNKALQRESFRLTSFKSLRRVPYETQKPMEEIVLHSDQSSFVGCSLDKNEKPMEEIVLLTSGSELIR